MKILQDFHLGSFVLSLRYSLAKLLGSN
jgi:large subunit ribosomal protein L33